MTTIRSSRGPGSPKRSRDAKRIAMRNEREANAAYWELDRQKKQAPTSAPARRHLSREQYEALVRAHDPEVIKTIRSGQRKPRTWDEINSSYGGGRDLGRPG